MALLITLLFVVLFVLISWSQRICSGGGVRLRCIKGDNTCVAIETLLKTRCPYWINIEVLPIFAVLLYAGIVANNKVRNKRTDSLNP